MTSPNAGKEAVVIAQHQDAERKLGTGKEER